MIKVVITGPSRNGYFPYRVDWYFQGRPQLVGLSPAPLLDACRQLQQMGLMDSTVVGLFDEDKYKDTWRLRTTVGYGATHVVRNARFVKKRSADAIPGPHGDFEGDPLGGVAGETEIDHTSPGDSMGKYREYPGGPILDSTPEPATVEPQATPAEAPPEPRTPPEPPDDTGPAHSKPSRQDPPHHKRKRAGSGARRGSR